MKIYDSVSLRAQEQALPDKMLVTDALKCLLAVSSTAKVAALEGIPHGKGITQVKIILNIIT